MTTLPTMDDVSVRIAVRGDISLPATASSTLRDVVLDGNRGRQTWFLADAGALREQRPKGRGLSR
ncbi:DUF4180 domain-containing protein [Streptomyces sp. NPDC015125]|uniref:DUF4180 domain-containing protein n=1 Tax=Streptomyces sp. NPDC015125 TaxID=3364938 RepID=UPI0036F6EEA5